MSDKKNTATDILKSCVRVLEKWENGDMSLDDCLEDAPHRNSVSSIMFEYFRNKGPVDAGLASAAKKVKPAVRRLLASALTQCLFSEGIRPESAASVAVDYARKFHGGPVSGFVNAVLRKLLASRDALLGGDCLPDAVSRRWRESFGPEKTAELAALLKARPDFTFRASPGLLPEMLDGMEASPLKLPEWAGDACFYKCGQPRKLIGGGLLEKGLAYITDPATTAAPVLARSLGAEFRRIYDVCSAPGGKSLLLESLFPSALIVSGDRSARRQARTVRNFMNFNSGNVALAADALAPPFKDGGFDLVFVDAPCTGTGTFRRRPDVLWRFSKARLDDTVVLQSRLLGSAAGLVCPGGAVVYGTCSVEPEENSLLVGGFLSERKEFRLRGELLVMPSAEHDGAYCALLSKEA